MQPARHLVMLPVLMVCSAAAACGWGGTSAPNVSRAATLAGFWDFTHPANYSCAGAVGAASYYFRVDSSGAGPDGLMNVASTWDVDTTLTRPWKVYGWMDLTTGKVQLDFWLLTSFAGQEFDGTIDDSGNVSGTLVDPKPGYQPQFALATCRYPMTGRRVGP